MYTTFIYFFTKRSSLWRQFVSHKKACNWKKGTTEGDRWFDQISLRMPFGFKLLCSVSYNRVAPASASSPCSVCSDRFNALGQSVVALDPRTNEDVADMKQNSCSIQSTVFGSCLFKSYSCCVLTKLAFPSYLDYTHTHTPFPTAAYRECELCKR